MKKSYKKYFVVLLVCLLITAILAEVKWVSAHPQSASRASTQYHTSASPAVAPLVMKHTVSMSKVPVATAQSAARPDSGSPVENDESETVLQLKAAAAHAPNAPVAPFVYQYHPGNRGTGGFDVPRLVGNNSLTPNLTTSFQGMALSNTICPLTGCVAPDMALAVSPNWVFQGVNTSFAVYDTSGNLQQGWPKNAQSFFGIPGPPNGCAGSVPYLIDPRAFYDPNDGRFWAVILQDEDTLSHQTSCPYQALYWIAVSQTSNPNGLWNVYSFDMSNGTTNGIDFTQFGFDGQAIYFSGNLLGQTSHVFLYAEIFAASKTLMESGAAVTSHGFSNLMLNGAAVDTVQPVETEDNSGPPVGLFVNSLNINFGGYACKNGCQSMVVWAVANPTSANPSLTSAVVTSPTYILPPNADEPGCAQCLFTGDTEISATPVYRNGLISFALQTGVNNGTQVVPGIMWGQISPTVNGSGTITGASLAQSGYFSFSGDTAAYYSSVMPDANGDLFMVFDVSSSSINPEVDYVARSVTFTPGLFPDAGNRLRAGDAVTMEGHWGDFNATSYDSPSTDNVWLAGEYSPTNQTWSTYIGESHFTSMPGSPTPTSTPTATPTPTNTPTPTSTPTATPTPTPPYESAVLADHPVVYYRLDESSGTTAADSSGNGRNGAYTTNATLNQSGATSDGDAAIACNGKSMQYSAGTGIPFGSAPFSVEAWFKTTATPSAPYGSTLVSWGTERGDEMFGLKIYSSTKLKLTNWTNAYYFTVPNGANTLDGNWHYVVATFDGTHATVYYDGQSLGTQTISLVTVQSSAGLVIGSQTGNNDSPYSGLIDEVAVYSTVLSASQVQTHYNSR